PAAQRVHRLPRDGGELRRERRPVARARLVDRAANGAQQRRGPHPDGDGAVPRAPGVRHRGSGGGYDPRQGSPERRGRRRRNGARRRPGGRALQLLPHRPRRRHGRPQHQVHAADRLRLDRRDGRVSRRDRPSTAVMRGGGALRPPPASSGWRCKAACALAAASLFTSCSEDRPTAPQPPAYVADVAPILQRCAACHQGDSPSGGWSATTFLGVIACVSPSGAAATLPADGRAPILAALDVPPHVGLLTAAEHGVVAAWVAAGAPAFAGTFHAPVLRAARWAPMLNAHDPTACGRCHEGTPARPSGVSLPAPAAPACTSCHDQPGGVLACGACHGAGARADPPRTGSPRRRARPVSPARRAIPSPTPPTSSAGATETGSSTSSSTPPSSRPGGRTTRRPAPARPPATIRAARARARNGARRRRWAATIAIAPRPRITSPDPARTAT